MGPHLGFQVKEEVSIGLGFDWAVVRVMVVVVVKRSAAGRKERILSDWWIKSPKECETLARGSGPNE